MWIFHNLLYKVAALLVACVLWAATQGFRSVEEGLDIPVSLENIPAQVVVVEQSPREINLRIVGSRAALRRAERQLVRYPISLEGVKPGQARYAVEITHLPVPRGAHIAARSPSAIVLEIEERVRKRVRVSPELTGEPAEGHALGEIQADPAEIELEGAQSALRRIREVTTEKVDVSGLAETAEREVRLVLGAPNVWRADDDDSPVRIRIRVEPVEADDAEPETEEGG